jgi:GTP-binding protein
VLIFYKIKMFFDEIILDIKSGIGGAGCSSFRREKFIPEGGPDGGNGGKGGNVVFKADSNITSLIDFKYKRRFEAENGSNGKSANKTGHGGKELVIKVPIGTQVYNSQTNDLLFDFKENGEEFLILEGGDGGFGNSCFKSSTNRAPRKSTQGFDGQEMEVKLIYKVFCDVGIIGKPNAGKSTFLAKVTNAKPKIGDYAFTTLSPNLGMVDFVYDFFTIADIPGLIEGASEGLGLGDKFLKHVERCKILLHLIDISSDDIVKDYHVIRQELKNYDDIISQEFNLDGDFSYLSTKQEIVILNKCDQVDKQIATQIAEEFFLATGVKPVIMSNFNDEYKAQIDGLLEYLMKCKRGG